MFYKQIYGFASVIAKLVLEDLENQIIPKLHYQFTFYKRYLDGYTICSREQD